MALTIMPGMATEVPPLFAGRAGPLWRVAFTGLGRPLAASHLPTSLQVAVRLAVSNAPPTYSVHRTLQVAPPTIGTAVNRSV
jgi:hypothetical protein